MCKQTNIYYEKKTFMPILNLRLLFGSCIRVEVRVVKEEEIQ